MLDDKERFCTYAASLGLDVPEVHRVASPEEVADFDFAAPERVGRSYVLKSIAYDPVHRLDLTQLPLPTREETRAFAASKPISADNPWLLQEFVTGDEYCTHATARSGRVQVSCCCESSASQLNYDQVEKPEIEAWVRTFVGATGATGQLSFDFIESPDGRVRAIECNPRTHSAITMLYDHPGVAAGYLDDGAPRGAAHGGEQTDVLDLPGGVAPARRAVAADAARPAAGDRRGHRRDLRRRRPAAAPDGAPPAPARRCCSAPWCAAPTGSRSTSTSASSSSRAATDARPSTAAGAAPDRLGGRRLPRRPVAALRRRLPGGDRRPRRATSSTWPSCSPDGRWCFPAGLGRDADRGGAVDAGRRGGRAAAGARPRRRRAAAVLPAGDDDLPRAARPARPALRRQPPRDDGARRPQGPRAGGRRGGRGAGAVEARCSGSGRRPPCRRRWSSSRSRPTTPTGSPWCWRTGDYDAALAAAFEVAGPGGEVLVESYVALGREVRCGVVERGRRAGRAAAGGVRRRRGDQADPRRRRQDRPGRRRRPPPGGQGRQPRLDRRRRRPADGPRGGARQAVPPRDGVPRLQPLRLPRRRRRDRRGSSRRGSTARSPSRASWRSWRRPPASSWRRCSPSWSSGPPSSARTHPVVPADRASSASRSRTA